MAARTSDTEVGTMTDDASTTTLDGQDLSARSYVFGIAGWILSDGGNLSSSQPV